MAGFATGLAIFLVLLFASEPGFIFGLDHANLLFHEAGHPIVGLFSNRLETYGGTLGQLTFPVLLAVSFWRKRQALSCGASVIWFFENWLNIARYMADARELKLPLLGGGDHDWNTIFTRWNVLQYDLDIAGAVKFIGWIGMALAVLWVFWHWWRDRQRVDSMAAFDGDPSKLFQGDPKRVNHGGNPDRKSTRLNSSHRH